MYDELLLIAHRGYSGDAPENTFAAMARGWNHIEFDVQLSRDGVPVVMHDLTLGRTTNIRGPLADQTLRDLRQLVRTTICERTYPDPLGTSPPVSGRTSAHGAQVA